MDLTPRICMVEMQAHGVLTQTVNLNLVCDLAHTCGRSILTSLTTWVDPLVLAMGGCLGSVTGMTFRTAEKWTKDKGIKAVHLLTFCGSAW